MPNLQRNGVKIPPIQSSVQKYKAGTVELVLDRLRLLGRPCEWVGPQIGLWEHVEQLACITPRAGCVSFGPSSAALQRRLLGLQCWGSGVGRLMLGFARLPCSVGPAPSRQGLGLRCWKVVWAWTSACLATPAYYRLAAMKLAYSPLPQ
ncbi:hypothetical protein EV1_029966 [Malus domestica]